MRREQAGALEPISQLLIQAQGDQDLADTTGAGGIQVVLLDGYT